MALLNKILGFKYINEISVTFSKLTLNAENCLRQTPCVTQVRWMSRVKRRHTVPPFWLSKTTRTMYPENVTAENQSFISEVIADENSSPLKSTPWERGQWTERSRRSGVIARKIGIYPMWKTNGKRILTTLLQVADNHVIKYIPPEELSQSLFTRKPGDKRAGLVVGADSLDPREVTKEFYALFSGSGVYPKKKVTKFLITPDAKLAPGTPLYASHFQPGNYVDVAGVTIDRGFQGVVKRWGFKGGPKSHGSTKFHQRAGYIGMGSDKAKVQLGKKMPGHMGREKRIFRGVKVLRVNTRFNVLWVTGGAIPGPTGSYVYIYDTVLPTHRYTSENHPPFPTFFQDEENIDEDVFDDEMHSFSDKSITFAE